MNGAHLLPVLSPGTAAGWSNQREAGQTIRTGAGGARIPNRTQAHNGGAVLRTKSQNQRGDITPLPPDQKGA